MTDSLEVKAILDTASKSDSRTDPDQWVWLVTKVLRIDGGLLPAVEQLVKDGGWRKAANPVAYLRAATRRLARRMGLAEPANRCIKIRPVSMLGTAMGHDDYLDQLGLEGSKKDGGPPLPSWDNSGKAHLSNFLDMDLDDDWREAAKFAATVADQLGLDEFERDVIEARLIGANREAFLDSAETEEQRLAYQAAWRRVSQHRFAEIRRLLEPKVMGYWSHSGSPESEN